MRRILRTATPMLAMTALMCLGASSALAKAPAKVLTLQANGAPLAVGAPLTTSTDLLIETESGNVNCPVTTLASTVQSNNEPKTDVLETTEATFAGEPSNEGKCTSTLAEPLAEPTVTTTSLPWTIDLTTKGKLSVKSEIILRIEPPGYPHKPPLTCVVDEKAFVNAPFSTTGEPLVASFTKVKTLKGADSGAECLHLHPNLSLTFSFTSEGNPVSALLH
jgi:hypothetical protein